MYTVSEKKKEADAMKLMIASDLHGSSCYVRKLMERMEEEKPDKLLLLGDLLYHGPRNALPEEYSCPSVADQLNAIKEKIVAVRGNCDSEVDQMVLEFPMLAEYAVLPVGDHLCYLTHGHNYGPDKLPPMAKGDLLISGHIHVPVCREQDGVWLLNPGSVSLPKENTPHSYLIVEDGEFEWKDVESGEAYKYWSNK